MLNSKRLLLTDKRSDDITAQWQKLNERKEEKKIRTRKNKHGLESVYLRDTPSNSVIKKFKTINAQF